MADSRAREPATLVSIMIATRQRREPLRRALGALARQTLGNDRYEVIVAVDGSTDGTLEMLRSLQAPYPVTVVEGAGRGRALAHNLGLAHAGGEILVLLDDDMEPAPELLEHHARHHPPGSRRCVMGAAPIEPGRALTRAAGHMARKFNEHLETLSQSGHELVAFDFYSGNASLRTEVMREVGGFDGAFVRYGHEDVELFIRLREAGVQVGYDPEALAWQEYDKDLATLVSDTVEAGHTAVMLAGKRPEVITQLPLGDLHKTSRKRILVRSALLALTRRDRRTTAAVLALARTLEHAGLWHSRVFYEALLDYAYWTGVDAALARTPASGALGTLSADLRRGPLDLLLHR